MRLHRGQYLMQYDFGSGFLCFVFSDLLLVLLVSVLVVNFCCTLKGRGSVVRLWWTFFHPHHTESVFLWSSHSSGGLSNYLVSFSWLALLAFRWTTVHFLEKREVRRYLLIGLWHRHLRFRPLLKLKFQECLRGTCVFGNSPILPYEYFRSQWTQQPCYGNVSSTQALWL